MASPTASDVPAGDTARLTSVFPPDGKGTEVSFEVFPPRQQSAAPAFWSAVAALAELQPRFISVTSGACGVTRDRTYDVVTELKSRFDVPLAAHITAIGSTRASVDALAERYWRLGIRRLVALRGDPPAGMAARAGGGESGYPHADDLVAGLRLLHPFDISVAAYPETHPEAVGPDVDLAHLKRKLDAGAARAITQFFFDPDCFARFMDRCASVGIDAEIVPGILPVHDLERTKAMAAACGACLPADVARRFDGLAMGTDAWNRAAVDLATSQCQRLRALGVGRFHFYTLNRADLVGDICRNLDPSHAPGITARTAGH